MTTTQSKELIGRIGRVSFKGLMLVDVVVLDTRESYGRTDLLVAPSKGIGKVWVSRESVNFDNDRNTKTHYEQ